MNPFDLRGPEFLLFYAALAFGVALTLYILRKNGEGTADQGPLPTVTDPYLVACLRGGASEVWRLATITLIDRRLLTVGADSKVSTPAEAEPKSGQNEVERATLEWFRRPAAAYSIFHESRLKAVVKPYENRLAELGLRPSAAFQEQQGLRAMGASVLLIAVTGVKICIALSRGHHNVLFLIVLTIISLVTLWIVGFPVSTARGKTFLKDMNQLFARLREPSSGIRAGESTQELAWLAAVFGLSALPAAGEFAYARKIYPQAAASSADGGSSSSCGSSSDSGSSSSCGSSCGGGGCGGGCGGCGS